MDGRHKRLECTPEVVRQLLAQGLNQSTVAVRLGVTRQRISQIVNQHNLETARSSRLRLRRDPWPWDVPASQQFSPMSKMLRDHIEYVQKGGEGLSPERLQRLRTLYRNLLQNNLVIEHDPSLPPIEDNKHGGWAYRDRLPSDGDLIIRVNDVTRDLTEKEKVLWKLPRFDPEI